MNKFYFIANLTIIILAAPVALALPALNCSVLNGRENSNQNFLIYPRRGSQDFQINDDGCILSITWTSYASDVEVTQIYNPHFPLSLPFSEKTLAKETRSADELSQSDVISLSTLGTNLRLKCEETER